MVSETIKSMLFKSFEPFGEPSFTLLNQLEYFVKTVSFFVKLYCFATFFISLLIVHRLFLLPKVFGRSLGDVKIGLRCYDIFKVYDVMNRKFNNEVQHLGEQKGKCYLKCLWEKDIII